MIPSQRYQEPSTCVDQKRTQIGWRVERIRSSPPKGINRERIEQSDQKLPIIPQNEKKSVGIPTVSERFNQKPTLKGNLRGKSPTLVRRFKQKQKQLLLKTHPNNLIFKTTEEPNPSQMVHRHQKVEYQKTLDHAQPDELITKLDEYKGFQFLINQIQAIDKDFWTKVSSSKTNSLLEIHSIKNSEDIANHMCLLNEVIRCFVSSLKEGQKITIRMMLAILGLSVHSDLDKPTFRPIKIPKLIESITYAISFSDLPSFKDHEDSGIIGFANNFVSNCQKAVGLKGDLTRGFLPNGKYTSNLKRLLASVGLLVKLSMKFNSENLANILCKSTICIFKEADAMMNIFTLIDHHKSCKDHLLNSNELSDAKLFDLLSEVLDIEQSLCLLKEKIPKAISSYRLMNSQLVKNRDQGIKFSQSADIVPFDYFDFIEVLKETNQKWLSMHQRSIAWIESDQVVKSIEKIVFDLKLLSDSQECCLDNQLIEYLESIIERWKNDYYILKPDNHKRKNEDRFAEMKQRIEVEIKAENSNDKISSIVDSYFQKPIFLDRESKTKEELVTSIVKDKTMTICNDLEKCINQFQKFIIAKFENKWKSIESTCDEESKKFFLILKIYSKLREGTFEQSSLLKQFSKGIELNDSIDQTSKTIDQIVKWINKDCSFVSDLKESKIRQQNELSLIELEIEKERANLNAKDGSEEWTEEEGSEFKRHIKELCKILVTEMEEISQNLIRIDSKLTGFENRWRIIIVLHEFLTSKKAEFYLFILLWSSIGTIFFLRIFQDAWFILAFLLVDTFADFTSQLVTIHGTLYTTGLVLLVNHVAAADFLVVILTGVMARIGVDCLSGKYREFIVRHNQNSAFLLRLFMTVRMVHLFFPGYYMLGSIDTDYLYVVSFLSIILVEFCLNWNPFELFSSFNENVPITEVRKCHKVLNIVFMIINITSTTLSLLISDLNVRIYLDEHFGDALQKQLNSWVEGLLEDFCFFFVVNSTIFILGICLRVSMKVPDSRRLCIPTDIFRFIKKKSKIEPAHFLVNRLVTKLLQSEETLVKDLDELVNNHESIKKVMRATVTKHLVLSYGGISLAEIREVFSDCRGCHPLLQKRDDKNN